MSSWAKSSAAARRQATNPNGSASQLRMFRRAAPYPSREERAEELKDALDSYEELEIQNYSANVKFESYKQKPAAKSESCTPADRRKALYQKFYRLVQEERKAADCVVLSVTNQCLDYPKTLSQCLQERGLSVEMLYLQAESGLTRALQDVRAEGSPLCILVEQKNIALSSCTVIIFSESLKSKSQPLIPFNLAKTNLKHLNATQKKEESSSMSSFKTNLKDPVTTFSHKSYTMQHSLHISEKKHTPSN